MSEDPKMVSAFYLNLANPDGTPSIFIILVVPGIIIDVKSTPPAGSLVTVQVGDKKEVVRVTQSPENIARGIELCHCIEKKREHEKKDDDGICENRE